MVPPNQKSRSDEQTATAASNFAKRHKWKRGGRTKNSLQNYLDCPLLFAMEAKNDHEIDGPAESTQRHVVNDNNGGNMMLHQEPQAPPQQTPLDATAQPTLEEQALNG